MEEQNQQSNQQPNQTPIDEQKRKRSKRITIALLVLTAVLLAVVGILLFAFLNKSSGVNPITYVQCSQLEQEIDRLIKQVTYCDVDEDCVVPKVYLPAGQCSCLYAVNKGTTDFSELENASIRFNNSCAKDVVCEACAPLPQLAKCEQNQCVGVWDQENSAIDTYTWQTYRSDEFGFEVKYPEEWIVEVDTLFYQTNLKSSKTASDIIILEYENPENLPFDEWVKKLSLLADDPLPRTTEEYAIFVNGVKAYRFDSYPSDRPRTEISDVFIESPTNRILGVHLISVIEEDREAVDQILATFRFVGE